MSSRMGFPRAERRLTIFLILGEGRRHPFAKGDEVSPEEVRVGILDSIRACFSIFGEVNSIKVSVYVVFVCKVLLCDYPFRISYGYRSRVSCVS